MSTTTFLSKFVKLVHIDSSVDNGKFRCFALSLTGQPWQLLEYLSKFKHGSYIYNILQHSNLVFKWLRDSNSRDLFLLFVGHWDVTKEAFILSFTSALPRPSTLSVIRPMSIWKALFCIRPVSHKLWSPFCPAVALLLFDARKCGCADTLGSAQRRLVWWLHLHACVLTRGMLMLFC